jgi:biopolymer transport protein ExbB
MPRDLLDRTIQDYRESRTSPQMLSRLARSSPLGQVFAAGLRNAKSPPAIIKEAIEESGRTVAIELERFLTSLGTIAVVAPLLGLFGTVVGMIQIFGAQTPQGTNPLVLAHGISIALYNTAFGLVVAIPAMIFYRHFRAKVDVMLVDMEMQAIKLVEIIHGERQ